MYELVGGSAIARRIAAQADELRAAGFELIAFEGQDHIGALAETGLVAPRLSEALAGQAGDGRSTCTRGSATRPSGPSSRPMPLDLKPPNGEDEVHHVRC